MSNWYLENGKESDIVSYTKIALDRNLTDLPFRVKMTKEEQKELLEKVKYITPSIGYGLKFISLEDMDNLTQMSLVEKQMLPIEMTKQKIGAILVNEEENVCILVNGEEHLKIQVFASGFDLKNALAFAIEIEEKLNAALHFAYSEKYGFLTSSPFHVGTGLKIHILLHLPALKITGNLEKVMQIINHFGMSVQGMYGEESRGKGGFYQISNNQTIGLTEQEIATNVENIIKKVMEQERIARKYLGKNEIELKDKIYRSYGILTNAMILTYEEFLELYSDIKLGTDLGILDECNDAKIKKLAFYAKPANLQIHVGNMLNGYERNLKRAEMIKQILKHKEG